MSTLQHLKNRVSVRQLLMQQFHWLQLIPAIAAPNGWQSLMI